MRLPIGRWYSRTPAWFPGTSLSNVTLGLRHRDADQRGRQALDEVGLAAHARCVALHSVGWGGATGRSGPGPGARTRLILADEPFGSLDALTRLKMHDLLAELCARHNPAVLLVTHDVDEAIGLADRIVVLDGGRIIFDRTVDVHGRRERHHPRFIELRARLLAALGVGAGT